MKKIRIEKEDIFRVLLTEVLPFETPLFFSNEGFYRYAKLFLKSAPQTVRQLLYNSEDGNRRDASTLSTIPYSYKIRKGTNSSRTLSVMHPAVQLEITEFYKDYSQVILHLCNRSEASLRHPAEIGEVFFWPELEGNSEEIQYATSFFRYEKFKLVHSFYDSYEFRQLEKRFPHLLTFDISRCFNSIYSHSVTWAVRTKPFAKAERNRKTFDGWLDQIMQAANQRETAGILIGPEFSRIFAEIIFQRIESDVISAVAEKNNWKRGQDFDVRRYVDNFYVFAQKIETADEVMRRFHHELSDYRLYFNESKSERFQVPFMTNISCAKIELKTLMKDFFKSSIDRYEKDGAILRKLRKPETIASQLISNIKKTIVKFDVEYSSVTGLLFGIFEKRTRRILNNLSKHTDNSVSIIPFLQIILDVVYFVYSMDARVSTTHTVSRISMLTTAAATKGSPAEIELIKKKIHDEIIRILEIQTNQQPDLFIETLNLLFVLSLLGPEYQISAGWLDRMVGKISTTQDGSSASIRAEYFLIISLLFYIGNQPEYANQKNLILKIVFELFDKEHIPFERADFLCLFLDLLSCPHLDISIKTQMATRVRIQGKLLSQSQISELLTEIPKHQWFSDWNARDSVEVLLEKRRFRSPY